MDRERRWWGLTAPAWAVDTGLVLGVGVLQLYTSWAAARNQPAARPLDVWAYLILAGTPLALAVRRRHPEWTLAVTVAGAVGYFALQYPYALSPLAALITVHLVIGRGRRVAGWAGAGCLVVVPVGAALLLARNPDDVVASLMWSLVVVVVGQLAEVYRARREHVWEVERRLVAAEHGREEEALRRAHEERLRIARELHDVTSHTISVIALQAAAATEAVDRADGREQVRTALGAIRTASRQAMAEMTATLGVLRPDRGAGLRRPMPGVAQLRGLAGTLDGTGVRVEFVETGLPRPLPPALDLTVYRVVQEALTNVLRHARARRAVVTLRFETGAVVVQVDDDGRGADPAACAEPTGHGLVGMAERVAAVGGRLRVGPALGQGFQVVAWLPLAPEAVA
ncbi:sensor histidine kinase [Plantactinospora sp. KLBMP9567]|uniref:sensor histidine kinase n=1 Tax=Plantactinospora sp. KLBMP9567 TaxID=3085900 RepID=UPI00298141A6|nr:sensor histidine kinase [Plantactinospora sp. KLBMP9567]MDW5322571.1 sensor histidine kinase [Plantactinospora sp. KLBMP9567]